MTNCTRRTTTTVRHEVVVPTPSPHNEILLALEWARQSWRQAHTEGSSVYDNSIMLDVSDEEIIVYWEEEKRS